MQCSAAKAPPSLKRSPYPAFTRGRRRDTITHWHMCGATQGSHGPPGGSRNTLSLSLRAVRGSEVDCVSEAMPVPCLCTTPLCYTPPPLYDQLNRRSNGVEPIHVTLVSEHGDSVPSGGLISYRRGMNRQSWRCFAGKSDPQCFPSSEAA